MGNRRGEGKKRFISKSEICRMNLHSIFRPSLMGRLNRNPYLEKEIRLKVEREAELLIKSILLHLKSHFSLRLTQLNILLKQIMLRSLMPLYHFAELMKNAEYLLDSEAANILMRIQEQMIDLSKDSDIKLPVTFDKGLQYAKGSTQYTNIHSVRQVLQALKVHGVTDGEMCVLANVCPETVDEVFALIPSLKPKWHVLREPLVNVLRRLANLRKRT